MAKFSKILCCRGGTLSQRTLLCVQQSLLNMYRTGAMHNLSQLQTGIKVVIRQTFQMSENVGEMIRCVAYLQTWLFNSTYFSCNGTRRHAIKGWVLRFKVFTEEMRGNTYSERILLQFCIPHSKKTGIETMLLIILICLLTQFHFKFKREIVAVINIVIEFVA